MINVDLESISGALDDVKKLIEDSQSSSQIDFNFKSFKASNHDYRIAAIDGSHHNIKGINFIFSTLRAGYLLYQFGKVVEENIDPIKVEFIMNNNVPNVGYEYKHEKYYQEIIGDIPNGKLDFDKVTERIRTLLEWKKINELVDKLGKNDIIIFDGSLISGEISTSHTFVNDLMERTTQKGITLVGLSKDTSLSIESAPLPLALAESAKRFHPDKNWYVEYEGNYFVKFSKKTDQIFRVDAVMPEDITIDEILSRIGAYCFDPATFGYPYPMQKIHDAVRISEMEMKYCEDLFKVQCQKAGISPDIIGKIFSIYHNQLDIISYGR